MPPPNNLHYPTACSCFLLGKKALNICTKCVMRIRIRLLFPLALQSKFYIVCTFFSCFLFIFGAKGIKLMLGMVISSVLLKCFRIYIRSAYAYECRHVFPPKNNQKSHVCNTLHQFFQFERCRSINFYQKLYVQTERETDSR